ncbi:MAG TPA: glycosyltransferase family 39 protein [Bacteroidia bacterium]
MKRSWLSKEKLLLFLILVLALFLRVYLSLDEFLHMWDERFHAVVAKNLLNDPLKPFLYKTTVFSYKQQDWFTNHIWLHKQPLPLWLMALSIKCFGLSEFVIRIPSILLSTLSVYFTWAIAKKIVNPRIALLAAFFHAINGLVIDLCAGRLATDHYDTLFLVFIEGAIYFALIQVERKKLIWSFMIGLLIGLAILTKWLPALIVLPIWFLFSRKYFPIKTLIVQGFIILIVTVAVALPWQLYILKTFPVEAALSYKHNVQHMTEVLDDQSGDALFYLDRIRMNYSDVIYLPLLFFIFVAVKKRDSIKLGLLIWIFVPILFFSLIPTKMRGYILFTAPALFIVCAYFMNYLYYKRALVKKKSYKILIVIFLIASVALPIRYTVERLKLFEDYNRSPAWAKNYKKLAKETNGSKENLVFINVEHPIEFMFYSDFPAYQRRDMNDEEKKLYPGFVFIRLEDEMNKE